MDELFDTHTHTHTHTFLFFSNSLFDSIELNKTHNIWKQTQKDHSSGMYNTIIISQIILQSISNTNKQIKYSFFKHNDKL